MPFQMGKLSIHLFVTKGYKENMELQRRQLPQCKKAVAFLRTQYPLLLASRRSPFYIYFFPLPNWPSPGRAEELSQTLPVFCPVLPNTDLYPHFQSSGLMTESLWSLRDLERIFESLGLSEAGPNTCKWRQFFFLARIRRVQLISGLFLGRQMLSPTSLSDTV